MPSDQFQYLCFDTLSGGSCCNFCSPVPATPKSPNSSSTPTEISWCKRRKSSHCLKSLASRKTELSPLTKQQRSPSSRRTHACSPTSGASTARTSPVRPTTLCSCKTSARTTKASIASSSPIPPAALPARRPCCGLTLIPMAWGIHGSWLTSVP
jgi:hypothetical protein